jgi:hypothetical protein
MDTQLKNYQVKKIINAIYELDNYELVILNNEFCKNTNCIKKEIYGNDEDFFTGFFRNNPHQLAKAIFYGEYDPNHENIMFDGYGNLKSFSDDQTIYHLADTIKNIADHVYQHPEKYTLDIEHIFENQ